jgi:hypothetical protein
MFAVTYYFEGYHKDIKVKKNEIQIHFYASLKRSPINYSSEMHTGTYLSADDGDIVAGYDR